MRHLSLMLLLLVIGVGFALNSNTTTAQTDDTCPAFVDQAMAQVGDTCSNMGLNVACYGNYAVESILNQGVSISRFDAPADRIELASLNTIRTAPLNEAREEWEIALLNTRANLPNTAPGQSVVMMLVGDASIENQITPDQQVSLDALITVQVEVATNLRAQPSANGTIVGSLEAGSRLSADMLSEDQAWVRIPQPGGDILWISRDAIVDAPEIDLLPYSNPTQISPMQSFYFNTGIGQSSCTEASGTLFIQGPNNIRVDLQVNGVDISIGSTIALNFITPTQMQVVTLSGTGYVAGTTVPAGYAVTVEVDSDNIGIPGSVSTAQRMDDTLIRRYRLSEAIPETLLNYQIDLQPITETVTGTTTPMPITLIIEGAVQEVIGNILIIYDFEIEVDPDDPILRIIQPGDVLRINGTMEIIVANRDVESSIIHITPIIIMPIGDTIQINADTGEVWRDDYSCNNPPPAWALANSWRSRCEVAPAINPGGGGRGSGRGSRGRSSRGS
ncbi:MAG: SH3 domain-containing protein [Aggregatilineales bacterium]